MARHGILSRRQVLSASIRLAPLIVAPLIAAPWPAGTAAGAAGCPATAAQSQGPFYPTAAIATRSNLIRPARGAAGVLGERIVVTGRVTAGGNIAGRGAPGAPGTCGPAAHAEVEIWQADSQGRYNHPQESSGHPLDTHFLYWGKTVTDADGRYRFVTVLPSAYSAGGDWMRPPHIHFKIRNARDGELTTQMYFPGHPLNGRDFLLKRVPAALRHTVIAKPFAGPAGQGAPTPHFRFDIALA